MMQNIFTVLLIATVLPLIVFGKLSFETGQKIDSKDGIPKFCLNASRGNEPLFLTPLIRQGRVLEAQVSARVSHSDFRGVLSYSGFLSVSKINHLFFWYFPNLDPAAPLILWLQGGPGESSMFGLFAEHGPFEITDDSLKKVSKRSTAWTKTHSVIYMDSPVGSGFSFTENEKGYATSQDEVARDLYEALIQFFKLFPQQKLVDFWVAGESYAGKYVPVITRKIHVENQKAGVFEKINLRGMAIGSAFTEPLTTLDYGNFLYSIGLLGTQGRDIFNREEEKARQLILQQKFLEAYKVMDKLLLGFLPESRPSIYEQLTGLRTVYNYLLDERPAAQKRFAPFVQQEGVRQAIHVGQREFNYFELGGPAFQALESDIYRSEKQSVEELLNATQNYRILFYTGQLDVICAEFTANNLVQSLRWSGAKDFEEAERVIWREKSRNGNGTVFGYAQTSTSSGGKLVQVLVRNAGHATPFDQPEATLDMITRFTRGKTFREN